ncbi:MAG: M48 family metallopeptidase [Prochloraceae cyanobacterium]|nr:M48 family metallopeptidase [Prochloraceae cyanobacterium]
MEFFSFFYILEKIFSLDLAILEGSNSKVIYLKIILLTWIVFGIFKSDLKLFIICSIVYIVIFYGLTKESKQNLQSLAVGELRERIYTLADRARVKLEQVYILDTETINAFATSDNKIILTERILKYLNKREIDTVISHELGHLKYNHPQKLQTFILTIVLLSFFSIGGLLWFIHLGIIIESVLLLLVIFVLIRCYSRWLKLSRSFEYIADAEAVRLTCDPVAYIQALNKIAALNTSKQRERLRTHPTISERIKVIVKQNKVSYEQVLEVLKAGDIPYYILPYFDRNKIFSINFKQKIAKRKALTMAIVKIIVPITIAWGVQLLNLNLFICYLAGFILNIAIFFKIISYISGWGNSELKQKLKIKLKKSGFPVDKYQGIFVGFSPTPQPRIYEDFPNWDIGFLFITSDRLCYVGEEISFSLSRKQISAIELDRSITSRYNCNYLYISYFDPTNNKTNTFNFTASKIYPLEIKLQKWFNVSDRSIVKPYPFPPSILKNLPPPKTIPVSNNLLQENLNYKNIFSLIIVFFFLSIVIGSTLNLSILAIVYIIIVPCAIAILEPILNETSLKIFNFNCNNFS